MRKFLLVIAVLLIAASAFAVDFATFQGGLNQFAQDLAKSAPFNTTTGLNWSSAYMGQFPHLGLGVTVGATTLPVSAITNMLTAFGMTQLPGELSTFAQIGLPLPAYTIDARIGGFGIPFDIGLKFGYLPPDMLQKLGVPVGVDYLLIGGDFRYGLLKDQGFIPAISVGIGFNYLKEGVSLTGFAPSVSIANVGGHTLALSSPNLGLGWNTSLVELKAQVSKKILFITAGWRQRRSFSSRPRFFINQNLVVHISSTFYPVICLPRRGRCF